MTTDLAELFGNLTITQSTEPLPAITRVRESLPNPFGPSLHASIKAESPMDIYVPPAAVLRAVSLLQDAAKTENVGVRVVVNVQRDKNGTVIKTKDEQGNSKVSYVTETRGDHKGAVLIRYQGLPERKKVPPRTHSIVNDPDVEGGKMLRHIASGTVLAKGTHDEMKAALKAAKAKKG